MARHRRRFRRLAGPVPGKPLVKFLWLDDRRVLGHVYRVTATLRQALPRLYDYHWCRLGTVVVDEHGARIIECDS